MLSTTNKIAREKIFLTIYSYFLPPYDSVTTLPIFVTEDARIKDQENLSSAGTDGDNLKKKVPRIPLKTITNQQDNTSLRLPEELENGKIMWYIESKKKYQRSVVFTQLINTVLSALVSGIQTQNAVVIAVNDNLQVVNTKLNILIGTVFDIT